MFVFFKIQKNKYHLFYGAHNMGGVCMCVCVCMCFYIYIKIYAEVKFDHTFTSSLLAALHISYCCCDSTCDACLLNVGVVGALCGVSMGTGNMCLTECA